ncbi:repeat protein [Bacteroides sp. CAG:144]|nr:repeat protein [Bacteroides sp. CAG:144]
METVNKNTYTFPDRKYKNRFKNYSINGKSLLILLCFIFSSQVCLGLTIHDQTKYYTITVGRSITLYYYGISGAESFSATPWGMGTECIKVTSGKNGQTGWCTIKAVEKTTNIPVVTVSYAYKNAKGEIRDIYNFYNNIKIVELEAVSIPGTLTLGIGESYSFSPTLTPSDASTTYKWDSSDESVAKIENGTITALKAGNTIITCTTHNGKTAECKITVKPTLAENITIEPSELKMDPGERKQLIATFSPENVSSKKLTWESSDRDVAIVTNEGLVVALSPGWTIISANTTDGSEISASCILQVEKSGASGLKNIPSPEMHIYTKEGKIHITHIDENEEIKIYNPLGQIIYTGSPQDIPVLEGKGLYIIYIGKSAVKILL